MHTIICEPRGVCCKYFDVLFVQDIYQMLNAIGDDHRFKDNAMRRWTKFYCWQLASALSIPVI